MYEIRLAKFIQFWNKVRAPNHFIKFDLDINKAIQVRSNLVRFLSERIIVLIRFLLKNQSYLLNEDCGVSSHLGYNLQSYILIF